MDRRDHAALVATLAPDVRMTSPVTRDPFVGIDEVSLVIKLLMEAFEELDYPDEFDCGDVSIVSFSGVMRGRRITGHELLRLDEHGRVRSIEISARPPAGVASIARGVGPALARRRGRVNYVLFWLLSRFMPRILETGDAIGNRLFRLPERG
jgi:hypothetical protein